MGKKKVLCPRNIEIQTHSECLLIQSLYSVALILTDLNVFHICSAMFQPPSVNTSLRAEQRKAAPLSSFLITIQTLSPPPGPLGSTSSQMKIAREKRWRREKKKVRGEEEVKWKEEESEVNKRKEDVRWTEGVCALYRPPPTPHPTPPNPKGCRPWTIHS